jgi:hypothetical protein
MLARYDANDIHPEWVLILPSVLVNQFLLADSDLLWDSGVDQTSLIIWFQSSLFIQAGPLSRQSIIFVVFPFDMAFLRAHVNCWFKAILALSSQILRTIDLSSSGKEYCFYQIIYIYIYIYTHTHTHQVKRVNKISKYGND